LARGQQHGVPTVRRSDAVGDFGERRCNPMPGIDVDAEFVVALRFWTKPCPVLITRAELGPRIGRSNRPCSDSIGLFAYCSARTLA
jgi:hypothetical protein